MKKAFLTLISLVALIFLAAAFMPKDFVIEKNIVIDAPKSEVFDYLKIIKNEAQWSPWIKRDPNIVREIKGEDGAVGVVASWSGNEQVGVGEEEITNISSDQRIDLELRFIKPLKTTNKAYFITEDINNNQTKLTWGMQGRTNFPLNFVCFFMQKQVHRDLAQGLNNLKEILENQPIINQKSVTKKKPKTNKKP